MNTGFDVIVVGGGVIGMTGAWRLAQTGRRVLLLEQGRLGAEASSAAAGMLGAQLEVSGPGSFYQLCLESRALYGVFIRELFETTGIDAQLTHNGILQLAYSDKEMQALQARMQWQIEGGARAEWVTGPSVAEQEPVLSECLGALLLPDDSNVNAALLTRALATAVYRTCTVEEGAHVTDIQSLDSRGFSVVTVGGSYTADSVVIASGAWAERLLQPFPTPCTIRPVKGQLLRIRPRHGNTLRKTVFSDHKYLVPKRDGTIIVGATEDRDSGFDREVTADALVSLLTSVERIAPGLRDAVFVESWTGLRPGSPNGQPWIGEVADFPGLHTAVGHFRNGILLAPVTGEMIVKSLDHASWPEHWRPFHVAASESETAHS